MSKESVFYEAVLHQLTMKHMLTLSHTLTRTHVYSNNGTTDTLLTNMIYGSCTKLSIKLLGSEATQVLDGERPEMEDVVPGESVSLFHEHHPRSQKTQLDSCTKPAWSCAYYQALTITEKTLLKSTQSHKTHRHYT